MQAAVVAPGWRLHRCPWAGPVYPIDSLAPQGMKLGTLGLRLFQSPDLRGVTER